MQSKKTLLILILILLLAISGVLAFLFSADLQKMLGLQSASSPIKNTQGENITFNAGNRVISIPSKLPEKTLDYLKKEMTESAGLPLRLERKGNPLPFGIP